MKKFPVCGLIALFLMAGCNRKVSQEELIQSALDLKIEQWREKRLEECNQQAMADAEAYVDSILVVYSLRAKLDTIPKPPKPVKPAKPVFKEKPDSVVVKKPDTL